MLKSLKMMVAEDVTITEEVLVVLVVAEEVQLQEEKVALLQEEKAQVADSEATETQLQEKVVSAEEVQLQEKVALAEEALLQEEKVLQIELLDVLKPLVTLLDQEDQEKTNTYC
jgi:hypothetical protein